MKLNKAIGFMLLIILCGFFSACQNESVTQSGMQTPSVFVSGVQVDLDAVQLDLKGKSITDISGLYNLNSLTSVDLRNNPVNKDDIANFIKAKPSCQVLWSVPVYDSTFDSTADTIFFSVYDKVDVSDIDDITKHFDNLQIIYLTNSNISVSDYTKLKEDYINIDFRMTAMVWGKRFDEETTALDLSDCEEISEDTLIDELIYFDDVNAIFFGDRAISAELKNSLIEKYPHAEFEWQTQLLGREYLSTAAEIDISGIKVSDLVTFKNQLNYFYDLSYLDMCDSGLTNSQMEELILEYPQVKFVWRIRVGSWEMRTDVKAFGTCYDGTFEGGRWIGGGFYLRDSQVANLKYCTDLEVLDIGHQEYINDFSFLEGLTKLKYLIVALSKFEDMTLLANMKELEYLEIFNTRVSDLSILLELPNLKYLNCSQTRIPNVDYLVDLDQMEVLWLCNGRYISKSEKILLKASLPDCYIKTDAPGSTRSGWRSYDNQGYIDMRAALDMRLMFWRE